jgi:hypothetical protein
LHSRRVSEFDWVFEQINDTIAGNDIFCCEDCLFQQTLFEQKAIADNRSRSPRKRDEPTF